MIKCRNVEMPGSAFITEHDKALVLPDDDFFFLYSTFNNQHSYKEIHIPGSIKKKKAF